MDLKELKKLQEQLKKDREQLKKDQEQLGKDQGQLKKDREELGKNQGQLKKDQEELGKDQGQLAEDFSNLEVNLQALKTEKERLGPLAVIETEGEEDFNSKWLEGLVFRGRKEKKPLEKAGKKTKTRVFEAFERPMSAADVLSFRITGTEVIIVTADGQKVKVKK